MCMASWWRMIALVCAIGIVGCAATKRPAPPAEWDGLERREVKGLGAVYVRPNVQFPPYKTVMLDPVEVAFSKDWDPNDTREVSRHLDASDLQKIKDGLAGMFRESFSEQLGKGGYSLTETPSDETMRVTAGIIDLYINAPDTMTAGRSRTYTTETGHMTLVMEIRDAPSGQLLARVVDKRLAESPGGYMQWTNSVTNRADARAILDVWAKQLRGALDRLNGRASS
jgi:uncharacterized protein DUF3313